MSETEIKFGTDGWRGVMARDFTFDNVRKVAQAIAEYLKSDKAPIRPNPPVVVGFDRRFQSDAYAKEIANILGANELKTILLEEVMPTPAISYLSRKLKSVGVMVTASHNPASYNGIKIKIDGRAASEAVTQAIEQCLNRANPMRSAKPLVQAKSYRKEYLAYLKGQINPASFASRIKRKIVVDYMHGAAGGLMAELFNGPKLVEIHSERDPLFGGLNPEPIEENLAALKKKVLEEKALIGIALDGDGDRVAIVDDKGRYLTPCQLFPMIIEYLVTHRKLKGKIVQSVSMGYLAERVATAHCLPFEQLPVGFKHVAEQIANGSAVIGGEESGGYAWKGAIPERDGLLTGLLFLEMCAKTKLTPSQLWDNIEKKYGASHFKRVDFRVSRAVADKAVFVNKVRRKVTKKVAGLAVKEILDIDGAKIVLENGSWVLVRPSGTEPLVRTYAESGSAAVTQTLLENAAKWVNAQL